MQLKHHREQSRPEWTAGGTISSTSVYLAQFIYVAPFCFNDSHALSFYYLFLLPCICRLYLYVHALLPTLPFSITADCLCQVKSPLSHDSDRDGVSHNHDTRRELKIWAQYQTTSKKMQNKRLFLCLSFNLAAKRRTWVINECKICYKIIRLCKVGW